MLRDYAKVLEEENAMSNEERKVLEIQIAKLNNRSNEKYQITSDHGVCVDRECELCEVERLNKQSVS
jgi:hypothetical protein